MMRCLFKIQYEQSQRLYSYHRNVIDSVFHRMSCETMDKLYALILFFDWDCLLSSFILNPSMNAKKKSFKKEDGRE